MLDTHADDRINFTGFGVQHPGFGRMVGRTWLTRPSTESTWRRGAILSVTVQDAEDVLVPGDLGQFCMRLTGRLAQAAAPIDPTAEVLGIWPRRWVSRSRGVSHRWRHEFGEATV